MGLRSLHCKVQSVARILCKEREQEHFDRDCQGTVSSGPPEQQAEQRLQGKATRPICTSHWEKSSVMI